MYNNLKEVVQELIERGFEGNYWDFKQKWHKNNDRLLHDILCFANTSHVKDCFLIFGVSDNCEVLGVTDDENRKKQADVLDMLNNCSFAGDNKPKINLETIKLQDKELDILIIYNTNNTPLYITKKCKKYNDIQENFIYSREGDRNTSIKENSNIYEIERLWKKRFGLNRNCIEEFKEILKDKSAWKSNSYGYYYIYNPEFVMKEEYMNDCTRPATFSYLMTNERTSHYDLQLIYKGTLLGAFTEVVLDSGQYTTIAPDLNFIYRDKYHQETYEFSSYTKGTLKYLLYRFLFNSESKEAEHAKYRFDEIITIFNDEYERKAFLKYINKNVKQFDQELQQLLAKEPCKYDSYGEYNDEYLNETIMSCKLVKKYLDKFRSINK